MRRFFSLQSGHTPVTNEIAAKVYSSLINYVYKQANLGLWAALFCSIIVFMGLFHAFKYKPVFYIWVVFFLLVTVYRFFLVYWYKHNKFHQRKMRSWANLYIIGSSLGGFSWGLAGILLFHDASMIQQTFMILILAGVTAGTVGLSSGIPVSAICFLLFSLVPFISVIALTGKPIYLLFDLALTVYLFYSLALVKNAYRVIRNSIILKFENDLLLVNLAHAKKQLEDTNKKLEQAATHDPLTGIANRSLFRTHFEKAIEIAKKKKQLLALLYLDIDQFKLVNDRYGHHVGDLLLIMLIERLKKFFGLDAKLARMGGDEITIIIENVKDVKEISKIATEVCELFALPIKLSDIELKVTASIGISFYPQDGKEAETLLQRADACMYHIKERGGNNFYFDTDFAKI